MQALKDRDSDLLSILDSRAAAYSKLAQHDQALRDTKQMIKCGKNDERVRDSRRLCLCSADCERGICAVPKPSC